jgi:hypothetical protein
MYGESLLTGLCVQENIYGSVWIVADDCLTNILELTENIGYHLD